MEEGQGNPRKLLSYIARLLLNANLLSGFIAFMSVIAICIILHIAKDVFIPLVIAWFIIQIVRPITHIGNKLHLHPYLNLIFVFVVLIGVSVLFVRFIGGQVSAFNQVYSRYASVFAERYTAFMNLLNINLTSDTFSAFDFGNFNVLNFIKDSALYVTGVLISLVNKIFMTVFFLMFMLVEAPYTERKISKAFHGKTGNRVMIVFNAISEQVSYYMLNQALISLITAFCVWLVLMFMKVELSSGWAVLAFMLNFIPNVGSIIATILPVIMAFVQYSTLLEPMIVLGLLTAIQMLIGNIIGPKILSDSLGVSSTVILLSLLFWTMIWGVPGAFLSVPIASIIKIVCENIPSLRPIAVLMSNGISIKSE